MTSDPSEESTYRLDPVLAPFIKLLGFAIVLFIVNLAITGPIILMNLEEAKQSEYWPMFIDFLPLFGLGMLLFGIWAILVYRNPGMIYVEVETNDVD